MEETSREAEVDLSRVQNLVAVEQGDVARVAEWSNGPGSRRSVQDPDIGPGAELAHQLPALWESKAKTLDGVVAWKSGPARLPCASPNTSGRYQVHGVNRTVVDFVSPALTVTITDFRPL